MLYNANTVCAKPQHNLGKLTPQNTHPNYVLKIHTPCINSRWPCTFLIELEKGKIQDTSFSESLRLLTCLKATSLTQ